MAEMVTGDNFSTVVAIKLLHAQWADHEEILMRSRDEARLLGRLRHRSIVRVEDLTYIQGHCAVIMEYLEGADLKSLMGFVGGRGEHFPTRSALEVTAQVASALEAAYNYVPLQGGEPLRLVHRDIKPSNVMLTVDGDVKLLDFGTARANFDSREAHTESLAFGSQAYMAPERFMGDPDAPAGDIFSLGVSLYELLAGQNIGRILLREDRFYENLDERLAALGLEAMPEDIRHEARKVMRLMMDFYPENRPTAGQVVELMEVLAEKCDDDSMRRFSRKQVRSALEASPHEPGEDSLQGNTLVEDRSASYDTAGFRPPAEEALESETVEQSSEVALPLQESPASTFPVDTDSFGDEEGDEVEREEDPIEASGTGESRDSAEDPPLAAGEDAVEDEASEEVAEPEVVEPEAVVPEKAPSSDEPRPSAPAIVQSPSVTQGPPPPASAPSGRGAGKLVGVAVAGLALVAGAVWVLGGSSDQVTPDAVVEAAASVEPPEPLEVVEEVVNTAPTADAGSDQSIRLGRSATLTGAGEDADEGAQLSYSWSVESSPDGSTAQLAEPMSDSPRFTPDKVGTYTLQLVVSDGEDEGTDTVQLVVTRPPPPGEIRISLLPIGGADATLVSPGGAQYACSKNPYCMVLDQAGLDPGEYTLRFTARGESQTSRKVTVRSGKRCIYNVSRDSSVVQAKCE